MPCPLPRIRAIRCSPQRAWRLSYIVTSRKHPQEALDLAISAAGALERAMRSPSPEQLSVYGALHLAAATAAAAAQDQAMTAALLATARSIAVAPGTPTTWEPLWPCQRLDTRHRGVASPR